MGVITAARELAYLASTPAMRAALRRDDLPAVRRWWWNPSAADVTFLDAIERLPRPLLECGSGLTTLVLADGDQVSLEHDQRWAQTNRRRARLAGASPTILHAPLRSYGSFDWYDLDGIDLPERFNAVVCDGPPSSTRGGRYGLLPVMGERLSGATVLLDDADRPGEQEALRRWQDEFDCSVELVRGSGRTFARVVIA